MGSGTGFSGERRGWGSRDVTLLVPFPHTACQGERLGALIILTLWKCCGN